MRSLIFSMFLLGFGLLAGCSVALGPIEACGNGVIEDGEQCDGANLGGETCVSLGQPSGTLACTSGCGFDITGCTGSNPVCGNGVVEGSEQCDGSNLNGQSCVTQGYMGGSLTCTSGCAFDTSGCGDIPEICSDGADNDGDGEIDCEDSDCFGDPACDGENEYDCHNGLDDDGDGLTDCDDPDCAGSPACSASGCGDGNIQAPEACDGDDLGGKTCMILGYEAGELACTSLCGFDVSGCSNVESPHVGELIHVPGGTFQRDATATNLSTVSAFRMSKYEITRAQWVAVTGWADPSDTENSSGMDDPVQTVNWYHIISFCNKLSLREGLTPVYSVSGVNFSTLAFEQIPINYDAAWTAATANWAANGYRLPTEMEWMWAAMGADLANPGATNRTGWAKAFAGSTGTNSLDDYAVHSYGTSGTAPVGSKLDNELGFHDLSGNVWEHVWDRYEETYPIGPLTNYRGPTSGTSRVLRGGSWDFYPQHCAVSARYPAAPHERGYNSGFRVVRP